jgi:hypothetical protein
MTESDQKSVMASYRRGLLETEARIIAADERFLVLALRIDRATVARNLPFLVGGY